MPPIAKTQRTACYQPAAMASKGLEPVVRMQEMAGLGHSKLGVM